jgi:hypothetical protein
MHQNKISICAGAVDENRTRLNRIDNPLPSQRTTTAYMVRGKGIEPLTERWQRSVLPLNEPRIFGIAYGNRTRLRKLKAY